VTGFRSVAGQLATTAGESVQLTVAHTITLPLDIRLSNRYRRVDSRNWTRRLVDQQSLVDGAQVTYPDVSLQWIARPQALSNLVTSIAANARMLFTRQASLLPTDLFSLSPERRATHVKSWPLNGTIVWALGNVSTSGAYTLTKRVDSLPGSIATATSTDASADIGKAFALPKHWGLKSALRTRASYQETHTESFVSNLAALGQRSRLTNNGRQLFSVSADADAADNLTFSLQGSRVVTFDRNFNRKFVQTVFTAALQIQFFGGALR
jgi:hypothetical protein